VSAAQSWLLIRQSGRNDVIRQLTRLGHSRIDRDQQVQVSQRGTGLFGIGNGDVPGFCADDEQRFDLPLP